MCRYILLLIMLLNIVSCSSSVNWESCPDYLGEETECALIDVPLTEHTSFFSKRDIQEMVYRVKGTSDNKKGQIWFLQGGPGDTNVVFAPLFRSMRTQHPDWDFYTIEHRGVGNSTKLTCPAAGNSDVDSSNATACVSQLEEIWGADLAQFSTTNAAHDVNYAIEMMRESGKKVYIYGLSYGTYWLHRYVQLYPNSVDGFIFDSICATGACAIDDYDTNINQAGKQIMDLCADDTLCQSKLASIDADPWTAMGVIFSKRDAGTLCADMKTLFTRDTLRQKFGKLVEGIYSRSVIPAAIYRINRCAANDVTAIDHMMHYVPAPISANSLLSSFVDYTALNSNELATNIVLSELWKGLSVHDAQAIVNASYVSEDAALPTASIFALDVWPLYTDGNIGKWGSTNAPVLMMNSNIDGQTPFAWAQTFATHFAGSNQYFVQMTDAAHGTAFTLPMADDPHAAQESCGSKIMFSFIEDTNSVPDESCLDSAFKLGFDPSTEQNQIAASMVFDTSDLWD